MVKKIVLTMAAVLFACVSALAQNKQVTGTVTGPDGAPIVGATVVVEGTTLGTSTDLQGKYVLAAPANGVLVFSFIGYEDTKLAINGKTTVNATLKEASKAIEDVIVVAFGEAKRRHLQVLQRLSLRRICRRCKLLMLRQPLSVRLQVCR